MNHPYIFQFSTMLRESYCGLLVFCMYLPQQNQLLFFWCFRPATFSPLALGSYAECHIKHTKGSLCFFFFFYSQQYQRSKVLQAQLYTHFSKGFLKSVAQEVNKSHGRGCQSHQFVLIQISLLQKKRTNLRMEYSEPVCMMTTPTQLLSYRYL